MSRKERQRYRLLKMVVEGAIILRQASSMMGRVLDRLGVPEGDKKLLIEKIRSDGWRS